MVEGVLSQVLTPRQIKAGLRLEEDDHTIILFRDTTRKLPGGKILSSRDIFMRFNITKDSPTMVELQEAADRVLDAEMGIPFTEEDFYHAAS